MPPGIGGIIGRVGLIASLDASGRVD